MKIISSISTFLMVLSVSAYAEIYKCEDTSGVITYQPEPCPINKKPKGVVQLKKITPEEAEAAKAKLKAWQDQQAADEAARLKALKEQDEDIDRHQSLEYQRRTAAAQEKQAIEAERQRRIQEWRTRTPLYHR